MNLIAGYSHTLLMKKMVAIYRGIHFSIRDEVNTYFEILVNASTYKLSAPEMAEDLNKALGIIEGFLTENFVDSQQLSEFADFIQQRVELVKTNVPQSVDLTSYLKSLIIQRYPITTSSDTQS